MGKKAYSAYRTVFRIPRGRLYIVLAATTALAAGNVLLRWSIGEALDSGKPGGVSPGCGSSASGGVSAAALYQADAVCRDAGRYLPQDPAQDPAQLHGGFGKKRFGRNLRPLYNGCGPDRRLCGPAAGKGASGSGGMADHRRAAVLAETCFWGLPPTGLSSAGS